MEGDMRGVPSCSTDFHRIWRRRRDLLDLVIRLGVNRTLRLGDSYREFRLDGLDGRTLSARAPRIDVAAREEVLHAADGDWLVPPIHFV